MAAVETLKSLIGRYLLYNGTTTSGATRTLNQSLGTLEPSNWDPDKALAIVSAIEPIVDKDVVALNAVKTYDVVGG